MKKVFTAIIILSISLVTLAQSSGLENQFYFRFGYVNTTKSYLGIDEEDYDFWDYLTKVGSSFELGSIFMLNSIPMPEVLRIGINVDYTEISTNFLTFTDYDETLMVLKLAAKVGPSISYNPVGDMVIDVFFKAQLPLLGLAMDVGDSSGDEVYIGFGGVGIATGFNVRWNFIMAGFEFNTVKMKLQNIDSDGDYLGSLSHGGIKTALPAVNFTFGFCF
jgi:hypothetical protein